MKFTSAFFAVVLMIFVLAEIFPLAVGVEEESENFTVLISTGGLDKEDRGIYPQEKDNPSFKCLTSNIDSFSYAFSIGNPVQHCLVKSSGEEEPIDVKETEVIAYNPADSNQHSKFTIDIDSVYGAFVEWNFNITSGDTDPQAYSGLRFKVGEEGEGQDWGEFEKLKFATKSDNNNKFILKIADDTGNSAEIPVDITAGDWQEQEVVLNDISGEVDLEHITEVSVIANSQTPVKEASIQIAGIYEPESGDTWWEETEMEKFSTEILEEGEISVVSRISKICYIHKVLVEEEDGCVIKNSDELPNFYGDYKIKNYLYLFGEDLKPSCGYLNLYWERDDCNVWDDKLSLYENLKGEIFADAKRNKEYDIGEEYLDTNENGKYDAMNKENWCKFEAFYCADGEYEYNYLFSFVKLDSQGVLIDLEDMPEEIGAAKFYTPVGGVSIQKKKENGEFRKVGYISIEPGDKILIFSFSYLSSARRDPEYIGKGDYEVYLELLWSTGEKKTLQWGEFYSYPFSFFSAISLDPNHLLVISSISPSTLLIHGTSLPKDSKAFIEIYNKETEEAIYISDIQGKEIRISSLTTSTLTEEGFGLGNFTVNVVAYTLEGGREIDVPSIRGVTLSPVPQGEDGYGLVLDLASVGGEDAVKMMAENGINTVRTYVPPEEDLLDAFKDNNIKVIIGFPYYDSRINPGPDISGGGYIDYIKKHKDHPAILMWELGNEYNKLFRDSPDKLSLEEWWQILREATENVHEIDPNHPVSTTLADMDLSTDIPMAEAAGVDIIGLNCYRGADYSFAVSEVKALTDLPMYFSEGGADSYVGEENQADAVTNIYKSIKDEEGCLGITFMSWQDEWWKAGDKDNQNSGGGDSYNEEYWGWVTIDNQPKIVLAKMSEEWSKEPAGEKTISINRTEDIVFYQSNDITIDSLPDDLAQAQGKEIIYSAGSSVAYIDTSTLSKKALIEVEATNAEGEKKRVYIEVKRGEETILNYPEMTDEGGNPLHIK